MADARQVANELLVDIFDDILMIEENVMRAMGHHNVTMTEVHTIEAIGRVEEKTMSTVAEALEITVGTLTTAVNKLVKKNLVTRMRDEGDRRIVLIRLTEEGQVIFDAHEQFHKDMIDHLMKDLELTDECELIKSLANLRDFFKIKRREIMKKI